MKQFRASGETTGLILEGIGRAMRTGYVEVQETHHKCAVNLKSTAEGLIADLGLRHLTVSTVKPDSIGITYNFSERFSELCNDNPVFVQGFLEDYSESLRGPYGYKVKILS